MDANELRQTFTQYFVDRGHTLVPSAGLIPHHPLAPMFTNAGMVQFLPYFLGEEAPPYPRATSSQKCVRINGKHDDIENIGRSKRHLTFFEMLGNFSFGDYFKEGAIKFHWELFTKVLGMDGDRLWVTVHESDDTASDIWHDTIGVPMERIQRLTDDNFWEMGDTGPCGPSSEIFYDCGAEFGEDGGPAFGGEERFREIGNLVFMEFDRRADKSLTPLPKQNIDTGSGFERILPILQGVDSVWEIDHIRSIIAAAEEFTGKTYGKDAETDVSLRIIADHGRSSSFLISDGVFPSNEDRGYVLRRIIRRALRHAFKIGGNREFSEAMVDAVIASMGSAYPDLAKNRDFVAEVLSREEHRFRQTLKAGSAMLDETLEQSDSVGGAAAFKLHDTYGFPIELTREIAEERGKSVDVAGFEAAMEEARRIARKGAKGNENKGVSVEAYREVIDEHGPTEFVGYSVNDVDTKVLAVLQIPESSEVEIFLAATPFYSEQGGQVGDTGHITTDTGTAVVKDTTWAVPGLTRHTAQITDGHIEVGQEARAAIDVQRRSAIRRNHTGTHILHWALRKVLGEHVKQAGSLVAPDRLRFDFSHFNAVTQEELAEVERLANGEILSDEPVRVIETSKEEAMEMGAIAFFGEKYGEHVRMLQAGSNSLELCGGTHVDALGKIGPIKITNESSIGSNLRRIEAVTGFGALDYIAAEEATLREAANLLKAKPEGLSEAIERTVVKQKQLEDELKAIRNAARGQLAASYAADAKDGVVVKRIDGVTANELRELAIDLRSQKDITAVVLIGSPDGSSVSVVAATQKGGDIQASDLIADAAKTVGGGGGKGADLAMAGGREVSKIDAALTQIQAAVATLKR